MDVLDALDATSHLCWVEPPPPTDVDAELLALAAVPGVARRSIKIPTADARPHNRGAFAVTWTQNGRNLTREGSTLEIALRRALRESERLSAQAGVK